MDDTRYPHENHQNHLCFLKNMGFLELNPEHYHRLVRGAEYVCQRCGRAAKNPENLCTPIKLNP